MTFLRKTFSFRDIPILVAIAGTVKFTVGSSNESNSLVQWFSKAGLRADQWIFNMTNNLLTIVFFSSLR